jgi:putative endopeptidase
MKTLEFCATMRRPLFIILFALTLSAGEVAAPQSSRGFDPANMDTSVNPCSDFYQYAVGAWEQRTTIPAEYAKYGVDQEVEERTSAILKDILEGAAADATAPPGSERRKLGDFFAAGMDESRIEAEGAQPLDPFLTRIAVIRDRRALAAAIAFLQEVGADAAFRLEVGPDDRNSARNILQLSQGGLGLPDRDYYLKQDAASAKLRRAYAAHVERTFGLLGDPAPAARRQAQAVLRLETRLARASMTRTEAEDPIATYHKMTARELARRASGFEWNPYFAALGLKAGESLLVRQPGFFRELGRLARGVPLSEWKPYLRWHLVRTTADYLSSRFVQEAFAFYGTTLAGTQALPPRWKRVLAETDTALGEALGKLYVERVFSPEAKRKALELVADLRAALRARIQRLPWMGEATKAQAVDKLDAMRVKVGYPDVWREYTTLEVGRTSYLQNVLSARSFEFRRGLAKAGRPVDPDEWSDSPSTNNAYYDPTRNELVFPAGILQPPFFDPQADDAVNYGNIGATIGHEMIHGFDNVGRQYDAQGNLRDWWTPEDAEAFDQRATLVVRQFDAFEPLPGVHINGRLTLGENLADLAGILIAYNALTRAPQGKPATGPPDGFTPRQRFFLNYAETWRFKIRPEALRVMLQTDEHAPPKYRVLGPLANLSVFATAFNCKVGDAMVRPAEERPTNW